MSSYKYCSSCGAKNVTSALNVAKFCTSCGQPLDAAFKVKTSKPKPEEKKLKPRRIITDDDGEYYEDEDFEIAQASASDFEVSITPKLTIGNLIKSQTPIIRQQGNQNLPPDVEVKS